jgi:hypothetical protein
MDIKIKYGILRNQTSMKNAKLAFYTQINTIGWIPTFIFYSLYKYFESIYLDKIEINHDYIKYGFGHPNQNHINYAPHLIIQNKVTKKYKVASYCDRAFLLIDLYDPWLNFDFKNCLGIYSSVGAQSYKEMVPTSYCVYNKNIDLSIKQCDTSFLNKHNKSLLFRGYLYDTRLSVKNLNKYSNIIKIEDKLLPNKEYIQELNTYKIGLSFNGAAEICHRDIEILAVGSVLLRPMLHKTSFYNSLIPNKHYIPFESHEDPNIQLEIIIDTYNNLLKDEDRMRYVAQNGLDWYNDNGSIEANVSILSKLINLEELL